MHSEKNVISLWIDFFLECRDNTNTLITEYGSGIEFIENYHNNKSKTLFYRKNLPREIVTMINRGRSNHYSLAASLAKIHIGPLT